MPQSLTSLYTHIIFSTKDRFPFLDSTDVRHEMHAFLGGVLKTMDSYPTIVGGVSDHVHILCLLSKNHAVSKVVGELKRASSVWAKTKEERIFSKFFWQNGYGAFSIGRSEVDAVRAYIESQQEHHRRRTFQEEYRAFLEEYGIQYDEKYVWD
jgi:putative transposase